MYRIRGFGDVITSGQALGTPPAANPINTFIGKLGASVLPNTAFGGAIGGTMIGLGVLAVLTLWLVSGGSGRG